MGTLRLSEERRLDERWRQIRECTLSVPECARCRRGRIGRVALTVGGLGMLPTLGLAAVLFKEGALSALVVVCGPIALICMLLLTVGFALVKARQQAQRIELAPRFAELGVRLTLNCSDPNYCALIARLNPQLAYAVQVPDRVAERERKVAALDLETRLYLQRHRYTAVGGFAGCALAWLATGGGLATLVGLGGGAFLGWAGVLFARFRLYQQDR